jgi:DNA-binding beta-propeller fold protein YncE
MRRSRILWAGALGVGLTACSTPSAGSGASTTPARSSIAPSAPSTATATATSAQAVGPVLGCSTAVASAPTLGTVQTSFSSGPLEPFGVAISPDSRTAFVADASGAIYVYSLGSEAPTVEDVDSFRVTSTDGSPPQPGVSPLGLASTPNGKYLIAADDNGGAVVFNASHLEEAGSHWSSWRTGTLASRGQGAIEAAISPGGTFVFVTLENSDGLAVFDLKRALLDGFGPSDLVGTVPLGVAPVGMAISPNGRYLYVTSEAAAPSQNEGTLTTIDLATAEQEPSRSIVSTVSAGCSPVRVVATSSSVYVTARGSDALLDFAASDLVAHPTIALQGVVRVGEAPVGVALVDHDKAVVIADSDRFSAPGAGASLAVVTEDQGGNLSLAGYVKSGSFPRDVAVAPNGSALLVSNFGSGQVEEVAVATLP